MTTHQNAQYLEALLNLSRKPVGIKFLLTKQEYESFPADELGSRMSYCTVVRRASGGKCQKFHLGHMACVGGSTALGLEKPTEIMLSGERRFSQGAYKDLCVCRKVSKKMTCCRHSAYGVAVLPLERFEQDPDVVILVCNPFSAMRIVQGYAYKHGQAENICLSGMQAICQECTSFPYENDQFNLSMLCSGTRMLASWSKDEMAIGMPYHLFEQIVEGVKATVNPLERNAEKEAIKNRLAQSSLDDGFDIVFGRNYDDNCYKGGPVGEPSKLFKTE